MSNSVKKMEETDKRNKVKRLYIGYKSNGDVYLNADHKGKQEKIYVDDVFETTDGDGWIVGTHIAKMNEGTSMIDPTTTGAIIGRVYYRLKKKGVGDE